MWFLVEKLVTAARGRTRESLEEAVDANSLRILAQETYECETQLRQAKEHLTQVMAEKLRLQRQVQAYKAKQVEQEALIKRHLAANEEAVALKVADDLAQHESLLEQEEKNYVKLEQYEQRLLQSFKTNKGKLEHYRSALRMAQATEHAQRALGIAGRHCHSQTDTFMRMQDSLERIQSLQTAEDDRLHALEQIDHYLKGDYALKTKAADVLTRIKNQL